MQSCNFLHIGGRGCALLFLRRMAQTTEVVCPDELCSPGMVLSCIPHEGVLESSSRPDGADDNGREQLFSLVTDCW